MSASGLRLDRLTKKGDIDMNNLTFGRQKKINEVAKKFGLEAKETIGFINYCKRLPLTAANTVRIDSRYKTLVNK